MDRDNDERFGEGLARWIPFMSKISVKDVAKAMFLMDLKFNTESNNCEGLGNEDIYEVIENDQMIKLVNEK